MRAGRASTPAGTLGLGCRQGPRRRAGAPRPGAARSPRAAPAGLPEPPTWLVGRERELAAVTETLLRDDVRLVTLTGPAGVGKTRLALEAARTVRPAFADGVWLVDLAPVRRPDAVLEAIARALNVRED